jgi:DNA-binding NarL/FixJ family response regulator
MARCSSEDDLVRSLDSCRPDIIMLAEDIVGRDATRAVLRLRAHNCSAAMIFLLDDRDMVTVSDLVGLDVLGILLSDACATSFIDCVEAVHHGRKWLDPDLLPQLATAERSCKAASGMTSREADIAQLISRGWHNKQIARELHLSEGTVKMHLHHIYEKLRLSGRTHLALSMVGACASMPVSGNGARSAGEDSAADARFNPENAN